MTSKLKKPKQMLNMSVVLTQALGEAVEPWAALSTQLATEVGFAGTLSSLCFTDITAGAVKKTFTRPTVRISEEGNTLKLRLMQEEECN